MSPSTIIFFFSHIFLLMQLASFATAQPVFYGLYCSDKLNYTTNSTYRRNLNSLLSSFASNTEITDGFYNLSVGDAPNQVNGIALCRGDVKLQECQECIKNSTIKIIQVCPKQIESIGYYDLCLLRYTNRSIFGVVDRAGITFYFRNENNVPSSELDQFNQALKSLMMTLKRTAASGDSTKKFATGSESAGFDTIYGLMQCTPDLSGPDCENCLGEAVSEIPLPKANISGKIGGRVVKPSCNLRFETKLFYEINTSPPPASSPPQEKRTVIIVIVVVTVFAIILTILTCIFMRRRNKKKDILIERPLREIGVPVSNYDIEEVESLQFDLDSIGIATNDFSEANKLGEGGFGVVYMGTLPNGQEIAVKRLSKGSTQGELEFKNEVLLMAKLQHRNLVRLLGFCYEGEERLLVYEFVANSSLDNFIFDPIKKANLDWTTRYRIIGGIARGLVYLHEDSRLKIIHRDLKASNILLDEEMTPKISDFGLARLFAADQTQDDTSRIAGTFGYMAPEYVTRGHFSVKSDVFSFGVLFLEIVSGQKNNRFGEQGEVFLTYVWKKWNEGTALDVIDPTLIDGSVSEMMRCIHIGLLCVQESEARRPTMAQVMTMLSSNSITLSVPSKPAFFNHTEPFGPVSSSLGSGVLTESDGSRSTGDNIFSINEASITELHPR